MDAVSFLFPPDIIIFYRMASGTTIAIAVVVTVAVLALVVAIWLWLQMRARARKAARVAALPDGAAYVNGDQPPSRASSVEPSSGDVLLGVRPAEG